LSLYLLVLLQAPTHRQDLDTYLSAGRDLLAGRPLYAPFLEHPFPDPTLRPAYIYPPPFAILVAPLALLPGSLAVVIWLLAENAALAVCLTLVMRRAGTLAAGALALLATLTFYPLWVEVIQGQANLFVLLLVTLGIVGITRGRDRAAIWLGVAAALKLTPLALLGWLLWARRFRSVGWLLLGFAVPTAMAGLARPQDALTFYRQVAPALSAGTAYYGNQSLNGVLARLFSANPYTRPWIALPAEPLLWLGAAGLLAAGWAWWSRHAEPADLPFTYLPLVVMVSAVTWEHHLVLLLPVIWLCTLRLLARSRPVARGLVLAAISILLTFLPHWHQGPVFGTPGFRDAQTHDPLVLLTANSLFLGTLTLLVVSPWLLRRR